MDETMRALRGKALNELKSLDESGHLGCQDWEFAKTLLSAVSKIDTIAAMQDAGYSERGYSFRDGDMSYGAMRGGYPYMPGGYSYADNGNGRGGNGYGNGGYGGSSYAGGNRREIEDMLRRTTNETDRAVLQRMLREM